MKKRAGWWWIDRWRKSTAYTDMTAEQQGVYRNLLDELWLRDGVLPLDERALVKISGDPEAWPRVRSVVLARFRKTPEGYRNDTHDEVANWTDGQAEKGRKRAAAADRNGGRFTSRTPADEPAGPPAESPAEGTSRTPPSVAVTVHRNSTPLQEQPNGENGAPSRTDYIRAVMAAFNDRRGTELPEPSSSDVYVAGQWHAEGIPLRVVLRGIAECSGVDKLDPGKRQRITLAYFRPAVKEAEEFRRKAVG